MPIEFEEKMRLFNRNIKKRIGVKQKEIWKEVMNCKPSLQLYREDKV